MEVSSQKPLHVTLAGEGVSTQVDVSFILPGFNVGLVLSLHQIFDPVLCYIHHKILMGESTQDVPNLAEIIVPEVKFDKAG